MLLFVTDVVVVDRGGNDRVGGGGDYVGGDGVSVVMFVVVSSIMTYLSLQ